MQIQQLEPKLHKLSDTATTAFYSYNINASSLRTTAGMLLALLIVISITPQGASLFESSMAKHMLVQFPLLIILAALSYQPKIHLNGLLSTVDPSGAIAFIAFSGWMLFWMLPLNLDLATIEPSARLLKLVSVPIGLGCCFKWLWHRSNAVLKCVIVFEVWASVTRLGWLYIESPLQLCSSYLIGEQQQVGFLLLVVSTISAVLIVFYTFFGNFNNNINQ